MSSNALIASATCGPLLSITHSARWRAAASVTSAREGCPVVAKVSSIWVAQMAGTWAASDRARIWRGTFEMRSNP